MKKWFLKNKWTISGLVLGALTGYIYYTQVGCGSGSCAITSNPYMSILYFAILGGLAAGIVKPTAKTKKN